jgi:DNA-binding response OmpR family regulator
MSIRILCVDDNLPLLKARNLLLSRLGYDVLTAATAEEARSLFHSNAIDLAILDYRLPDVSGDELCMEFKELQPDLRVILVSGAYPDRDCDCADDFVLKGQSPTVLLQAIAALTRQAA